MARILSKNGKIILNVPFYYYLHEEPHDYYRYTEHALRRFVEKSGLRLIMLESTGGAIEVVSDIAAKNMLRLGTAGRLFSAAIQFLALAFFGTKLGKKVSVVTGRSFPLGYCLVAEKPGCSEPAGTSSLGG
jgi:hypothetical protein